MCQLRLAKVLMEFKVRPRSSRSWPNCGERRLRQLHDHEIQLVVKQGQVEIDLGDFCPDFTGSALIHRSRVELLNKQILGIGGKKLEVMRDALRFRRGIVMQRWEYERCRMTLEDLVQTLRDIDFMKVTRAIQQYLSEGGDTTEKKIARLERRLDILYQRLALEARELNVDVSERELLYDIRCNHQRAWQARQRLDNLRKIRDLCDIAGFQQRYMTMLHSELQRMYSKTFPMLHAIN
ncbi:cilia- and flagella-associated protein 43-like [Pollicipes pollicipes]|uniref:cilia- and flagella-associated protein 43-like n=1 Tax=Pollicipes pollicipes TaxID=41117 RepID=UPI0018853AF9|nr:cilia- and flagella-associated protein 43-like [Pollicipes pollicipes]